MKATVTIDVVRDDGTRMIREVKVGQEKVYRFGGFVRETRKDFRQRLDRSMKAALNATVGGAR